MALTDAQVSRLTAALNRQLEADKEFQAKVQAKSSDPPSPSSSLASPLDANKQCDADAGAMLDQVLSPPSLAPTALLKPDEQFEAKTAWHHRSDAEAPPDPTPVPSPPAAVSSPVVPQVFEDRYAKGWGDAWEYVKPQLDELHRRYILRGMRLSSANRWIRWLPVICFCCTLFGFALGWCWGTLSARRSWHTAQQIGTVPKAVGDRGDKITP